MSYLNIGNYEQYRWQYRRYHDWFRSNDAPYEYLAKVEDKTSVDFERPELQEAMIKYITIRDCLLGEANIKSLGDIYLPRPSDDIDQDEQVRFQKYLRRATFLNATGLTQRTIVGKLMSKPPSVELPTALEALKLNVNGEGLSINQMIEQALSETFAFGRCGLFADFQTMDNNDVFSVAETEVLAPTISFVRAENIINWRIDKNRRKVVLVVVREFYEVYDKFSVKTYPQYRVFAIDENDQLTVSIYRPKNPDQYYRGDIPTQDEQFLKVETYMPKMANKEPWSIIPFSIVGSTDNDWTIDEPPLYQIATYDLALYRNSADIEEAAFYVGQPTPYVAGITTSSADALGIKRWKMGSGRFLPLKDSSAKVGLVQAKADTMLDKLIDHKMSILRHLGATVFSTEKLAEDQTATGAIYQALQIHAPLVTTSRNVVEAFTKVLRFAEMFVSVTADEDLELEVKLNSEILDNPLGITGLQMTQELYLNSLITYDEAREQVRVQGIAQHSPEEAREIIAKDPPPQRSSMMGPQRPQNDNTTNFQSQQEMSDGDS